MSHPTPLTTTIHNPRLRLLNKLRRNEYPLMTFMALPSVRIAQILSLTGLDGIIIDCEHGHISDDSMHNAVAAISALGVSPIIRIRGPAHDIIKRALDTGAHGIMVPQINNADEARAIVASSKFSFEAIGPSRLYRSSGVRTLEVCGSPLWTGLAVLALLGIEV